MLIRALEQQLLGERRRRGNGDETSDQPPTSADSKDSTTDADGAGEDRAAVLVDGDGGQTVCGNPEACLDSLLTSRAFRVLADQSAERGLDEKAAAYYEQATGLVESVVEEEGGLLPRPSRSVVVAVICAVVVMVM